MDKSLLEAWMEAKSIETQAAEKRKKIEDQMSLHLELKEDGEGSQTKRVDGFCAKITQRLNRKVNYEDVKEIVAANGIPDQVVQSVFRWKLEVNKKNWDLTHKSITDLLSDAINVTGGRPSYSILKEE